MSGLEMMDSVDSKIIEILRKDGRIKFTDLANLVGVPDTTVHFRVKAMQEAGIIKGFTVITDLAAELRSSQTFEEFVEVIQKTVAEQRGEVDLLWTAMRGYAKRVQVLEDAHKPTAQIPHRKSRG